MIGIMITALWLFCILASLWGIKEGVLWSRKGADAYKWNEHILFVMERIVAAGLFICGAWIGINGSIWDSVAVSIAAMFMFPFFHNGMYYFSRREIDGSYPKGFWDEPSDTSTASWNFSLTQRVAGAIVGVCILAIYIMVF